ncbi:Hsp20/alpha crystallin family protein [candidate division KSB1 bacterium]|nr:Hsp20/alpha crystallin family protein [candidate division KSB1 bacterium]
MLYIDPFRTFQVEREFDRMQREMGRLFSGMRPMGAARYPAVNIWSRDDEARVTAELPGYSIDDLNISVHNKTLTLSGKRRNERQENETLHRNERKPDEFQRIVHLPFAVDTDKVGARYEKGILTVTLPRQETDKPKKIEIGS